MRALERRQATYYWRSGPRSNSSGARACSIERGALATFVNANVQQKWIAGLFDTALTDCLDRIRLAVPRVDRKMNRLSLLFQSLPPALAFRFAMVYTLKRLFNSNASINYSQTGEDAIIRSLLDETQPGVYVDVGCNHPIHWSNTLSLYLHGWRGVNIDANPSLIKKFKATRTRDIAVCAAISDQEGEVVFHEFEDDLVSTVSEAVLPEWQSKWKKRGERIVKTRTLNSVLAETLQQETSIDLLSVDVEGHDLNVLKSIDLDVYRPKLIIVEMHKLDLHRTAENSITGYLENQDFLQIGYDTLNGYFVDKRSVRPGLRLP
jgi:FkbM family methyltransferase